MSVNEIRDLLWKLSGVKPEEKTLTEMPEVSKQSQLKLPCTYPLNWYCKLEVEQTSEQTLPTSELEATCARPPHRPSQEQKIPEKLEIDASEPSSNSLYLQVEIEGTETHRKQEICAVIDCGATGLFIDCEYVKSNRLRSSPALFRYSM
jgi:hypothetical protein